jgi:hypothetical protein
MLTEATDCGGLLDEIGIKPLTEGVARMLFRSDKDYECSGGKLEDALGKLTSVLRRRFCSSKSNFGSDSSVWR